MPKRPATRKTKTTRSKPSRTRASKPARSKAPRARVSTQPARSKAPRAPAPTPPARPAPADAEKYTQEYREYLERYVIMGRGRPRLSPAEFEKLDNELIDLLTIQSDIGALSDDQVVRLQELEFLLLESES